MTRFRIPGPIGIHSSKKLPPTNAVTAIQSRQPTKDDEIRFIGSIDNLADGDVRDFDVSRYAMFFESDKAFREFHRNPRDGNYLVYYVNGMAGSPEKFRAQCCAVAAVSGGPVRGVYNESGGTYLKDALPALGAIAGGSIAGPVGAIAGSLLFDKVKAVADLIECATDKLHNTDFDQLKVWGKRFFGKPQMQIEQEMIESITSLNPASGALLRELLKPGNQDARIVAHSQGNIIVCNAVNALAALRGEEAIAEMKIHAVASPVVFWSEAGKYGQQIVKHHVFKNDLVAWLGMNFSATSFKPWTKPIDRQGEIWNRTEVSESYARSYNPFMGLTHNFYAYLEALWKTLRYEFPEKL